MKSSPTQTSVKCLTWVPTRALLAVVVDQALALGSGSISPTSWMPSLVVNNAGRVRARAEARTP